MDSAERRPSFGWTKALLAAMVAFALLIAWVSVGNSNPGTNSTAGASPGRAASSVIKHARTPKLSTSGLVHVPPPTISDTCSHDVTVPLVEWLYSLPQGNAQVPTVVQFAPGGCYLVNGSMFLRGFRYFVFEGSKTVFLQKSVSYGQELIDPGPVRPAYCGTTRYSNPNGTDFIGSGIDIMWFFEGGCDIVMEGLRFEGPNNNGSPGGSKMQDDFVTFAGSQDVLVKYVNMVGPYGDYIDIQALHEANTGGFPATDVTVENSGFNNSGREGIGIVNVKRVDITNNVFFSAAATIFDVEADFCCGEQDDIDISGNTIHGARYLFLLAAETKAQIQRLAFVNNQMVDGGQMRISINPVVHSDNIWVEGNVATSPDSASGGTRDAVQVSNSTDVEVNDNVIPVVWYFRGGIAQVPPGSVVCGNTSEAVCPRPTPTVVPPTLTQFSGMPPPPTTHILGLPAGSTVSSASQVTPRR
jgi:hypothetical protein